MAQYHEKCHVWRLPLAASELGAVAFDLVGVCLTQFNAISIARGSEGASSEDPLDRGPTDHDPPDP